MFDLRCRPQLEKEMASSIEWPASVCRSAPVLASQSLTVPSAEADATSCPSGEKATALTEREWPVSVCRSAPVLASQSLTVSSSEADATSCPSGEKATAFTEYELAASV